jgi:hypothetical protein
LVSKYGWSVAFEPQVKIPLPLIGSRAGGNLAFHGSLRFTAHRARFSRRLATIIRLIYYSHMTKDTILATKGALLGSEDLGCRDVRGLQTRLLGIVQRWIIALQQVSIAVGAA